MPNEALAPDVPALKAMQTRAWAPGPGTARALQQAGWPAARLDSPPTEAAQFDSEALWQRVAPQVRPGARVLIGARARGGQTSEPGPAPGPGPRLARTAGRSCGRQRRNRGRLRARTIQSAPSSCAARMPPWRRAAGGCSAAPRPCAICTRPCPTCRSQRRAQSPRTHASPPPRAPQASGWCAIAALRWQTWRPCWEPR